MTIGWITCVLCGAKWFRTILDAPGPGDFDLFLNSDASQADVTPHHGASGWVSLLRLDKSSFSLPFVVFERRGGAE